MNITLLPNGFTGLARAWLPNSDVSPLTKTRGSLLIDQVIDASLEGSQDFDALLREITNDHTLNAEAAEARIWLADTFYSNAGETLKSLRLRANLTQTEIAEKIGTSQPYIAKLESGNTEPLLSTIVKLKEVLGVSSDTIIEAYNTQQRTKGLPL